jgi:hypothetical protein
MLAMDIAPPITKLRRIYNATVVQASCLSQARSPCYQNATKMRFSLSPKFKDITTKNYQKFAIFA